MNNVCGGAPCRRRGGGGSGKQAGRRQSIRFRENLSQSVSESIFKTNSVWGSCQSFVDHEWFTCIQAGNLQRATKRQHLVCAENGEGQNNDNCSYFHQ